MFEKHASCVIINIMRIVDSKFVTSVANPKSLISDDLLQVAFVGRSNVGKSSLLNMLTNRNKLARVSSTPGRTRLVNYFLINNEFYFVDLPGYGFAKGRKTEVASWQALIEPYLINNSKLKCVCLLLDIRVKPSELDLMMLSYLTHYALPFCVVATKCDKLSKSRVAGEVQKLANALRIGKDDIIATSSSTRMGQEKLLQKISEKLQA